MHFSLEWLDKHLAAIPAPEDRVREKLIFLASAKDYLVGDCRRLVDECIEESQALGYEDGILASKFYKLYFDALTDDGAAGQAIKELGEQILKRKLTQTLAFILQMIAYYYWSIGQRAKAFEYTFYVLKETDATTAFQNMAWTYYQLGVFYFDLKDYGLSLEHFLKCLSLREQRHEEYGTARAQAGIAGVYIATGRADEAIPYCEQAMEGFRKVGHKVAESRVLNDLGLVCAQKQELERAEDYLRQALQLRESFQYIPGVITSRMELARLLIRRQKNMEEAETLLHSALRLSEETSSQQKAAQCHMLLSDLHRMKNDAWLALEHLQKSYEMRAAVAGEETTNRINTLQQKFAAEKAEQETEIHRLKNVELKKAYDEIEEKNKSITDSIHYARRIQRALLGSTALFSRHLSDHFILYRPKDIVSGDFYWAAEVRRPAPGVRDTTHSELQTPNSPLFYFAACDCTGHGVPGAFMSLLNTSYLNEAVIEKGLHVPADILDEVRRQLVATLNPEGSEEETRDGMDATLLALDTEKKIITFACANNPLLVIRNGELKIYEADKFPVGIYPGYQHKPFTSHTLQLQPGDCVYLLTDGYADQFGGANGKKFKFRQLARLLSEIHALPMSEQRVHLERAHDNWKGELEQVDDILVIGFRA